MGFLFLSPYLSHGAELKIVVKKIPVEQGQLLITICGSEYCHRATTQQDDSVNAIRLAQKVSFMKKRGVMEVTVPNLPEGEYSVFLLQDKNEDGKVNFSGLLPAEPFGVSRLNSFPWTGEPDFEDSKVFISNTIDNNVVDIVLL